ncbi:MAG: DUF177 domain-containing protein [Bacteroidales bacterium]|nr:MAG: DUF177 domain-containing protein [Bacteroidales bacterium]
MSSILNTYSIHFKGLKVGKHTFRFEINNKFFEAFEEGEIKQGELNVDVTLNRQNQMLDLAISIEGVVEVMCDRCLENFDLPISYKGSLYVKFGGIKSEEDDEIIILTNDDSEINLAQYIYESVCLSLPIQRYHGMKGIKTKCNKEMIKKLKSLSANESKKEESVDIDPRWNKLKDIELN